MFARFDHSFDEGEVFREFVRGDHEHLQKFGEFTFDVTLDDAVVSA